MIGKKINQLSTELAPDSTDLTIIGDPISGVSKKITLAQLGAIFSGAVSFYTNLAAFPVTGDINVIYCAKDTQKLYLWSGSAYVEVFPSQALLNTYQLRSEKGVSNGYASLDSAGKVPIAQLPSSIMEYKGTWNAATNTPTLANGTGDTGDVYICNVAGTVNFGAGPLTFAVGDYVIYSGTIWQRSSGAVGTVTSVAASITGNSIGITGSPITTSGTLALAFAGTSAQYVNGAGNLITFPSIISQAQNLVTEVYNKTGATLTKGTVVYIDGGQGNLPSVTKALATGDATSAQTYGIVQADITNMNNGYVVAAGRLGDLDTQAFTEGTQLYLSATTAGTYTSTKQYAPNHLVYVAIVVRAHPTQGVIEVKIQNGYEMDELHNVAAQSPSNGDILQYVTSTSLWTKTAGTTTNIAEGTNLYYTEARVNANTNVAANTAARHNAVTIGTANGLSLSTQVLSLALASGSTTGALSSTDWTTFNSKQNALTNPVTGTGASGQVTYFNGTSTVTGSNNHFWDATNNRLGIGTTTPQRSIEIFNSTADNHLRLSGNAPSVSMGEAVTGSIYQAKFGLVTVNGQFVTAGVAGDFVIISQTGATIIGTSSTEKMRVQSSGNVSINNTNDTYKLDVTGTGRFSGALVVRNDQGTSVDAQLRLRGTNATARTTRLQFEDYNGTLADGLIDFKIPTAGSAVGARLDIGVDGAIMSLVRGGNVGIGTTSPGTSKLYVSGDVTNYGITSEAPSGYGKLILKQTSGQAWSVGLSSNDLFFYYGGTSAGTRVTFANGGNVGIGTTSPTEKLSVVGAIMSTGAITGHGANRTTISQEGGSGAFWQSYGADASTVGTFTLRQASSDFSIVRSPLVIASTGAASFSLSVTATGGFEIPNGQFYRARRSSGSLLTDMIGIASGTDDVRILTTGDFNILNGSLSNILTVKNGGNVGIGTTSPATLFYVNGYTASNWITTLNNTGTSGHQMYFGYNDGSTTQYGLYIAGGQGSGASNFDLAVANKFYVTSGGNVGIGNTGNASYKLAITGNTYITGATSTSADIALIVQNSSLTNLFYVINDGVVNIGNLAGTGSRAVLADASGFLSAPVSDISVKQNITTIGYGLNEILKMNPVWFNFIDGYKNYGEGRQNGNIAQEMKAIIPEAVFTTPSTNKMGINYEQLHAVYIKAIQELKAELDTLKNK